MAPVTVLITRRVRRGQARDFERLMAGMQAAAADFPGHVGGYLIQPHDAEDGVYHTLFAFDTDEHLRAWTGSDERQSWLRRIAKVTQGDPATRVLTGLETWFALPAAQTRAPPPRWKMAIVTWMGIFPLELVVEHGRRDAWPASSTPIVVTIIVTALIVTAMTWLVMPTLARLFAGWLYPLSRQFCPIEPTPPQENSETRHERTRRLRLRGPLARHERHLRQDHHRGRHRLVRRRVGRQQRDAHQRGVRAHDALQGTHRPWHADGQRDLRGHRRPAAGPAPSTWARTFDSWHRCIPARRCMRRSPSRS